MNIIYILLDQVRKDMLGAYGHQIVKTPNIDRLCEKSLNHYGDCDHDYWPTFDVRYRWYFLNH